MSRVIGVNTWVWTSPLTDENLAPLVAKVAEMGFGAIELPLEDPSHWDPDRSRAIVYEYGLSPVVIAAMGPGRSLVSQVGDVGATQDYLRACIRAAATVGSRVVGGPIYTPTGTTWRMTAAERASVVEELRHNLAPLVAEATDHGVTLCVEPLNRYETSLINTVEQALEALGPLLGDGLALALDTYHLNIEEKRPADAIRAAGTAIGHVQVCGNDRGAVGDDHCDWPGLIAALDDAGYDGILGVESFTADNATIAVAASVWRPLAPSQDALAERSLAFLQSVRAADGPP